MRDPESHFFRGGRPLIGISLRPLAEAVDELRRALRPTPIVALQHDRIELFAKLESMNPTGSVKDRSALWILKNAIARGEISRQTTVVESSSGNFAISLASFCRWLGLDFIPVVDANVTPANERHLRALCRRVEKVEGAPGRLLQARLARVAEIRRELPSVYWPDQYSNQDALEAHYLMTGAEICAELDVLDYVFVGVSTGGTIAGLARRVKESFPRSKVIAVDVEGSTIFGGRPGRRHIPGIGSSIVPELVRRATIDDVVIVSEIDTVRGCRELVARHGLFAGGSTGSAYAAVEHYFAGHGSATRPTVLFLCADRGTAYLDTVYDRQWVDTTFADELATRDAAAAPRAASATERKG